MKKRLFLGVLAAWFGAAAALAGTSIRITNGEWEPYLSQYSHEYGFASHVISEAFKLEGVTVQWGFFPWKRAYEMARVGKEWDASAVWWPTDEAKEAFLISDPVVHTSFVFFHLTSRSFAWKSMDDLKGITIGVTRGYDYGKPFMEAYKSRIFAVDEVTTDEQNFGKLLKGRIDVFPNDPIVGSAQIRNNLSAADAQRLTHHPTEFSKSTLSLIISRRAENAPQLLEKLNTGMKKLKKNGRLDQMEKDLRDGKYDKQKTVWHP